MSSKSELTIRENVILIGVMCYLYMATIALMTTSGGSRTFVEISRAGAIALVLLISAGLVVSIRMSAVHLLSALLYLLLMVLGFVMAEMHGVEQGYLRYATDVVVILAGLFIFSFLSYARNDLDYKLARYFFIYCVVLLLITVMTGGLAMEMPPRFVFDYVSDLISKDVSYSQGVSKFFGYGALAASYLYVKSAAGSKRLVFGLMVLLFLALSLLGGARGDSFFAVITVLFYFTVVYGLRVIWPLIVVAAAFMLLVSNAAFMNDLVLVQRMQGAAGGYGQRDVLLLQVGNLLTERVDCLLLGCGFGFFQHYFNYPAGLYPHNILAELIVISGLPLAMLLMFLSFKGVFLDIKLNGIRFVSLVFLYSFLLGLKSGGVSSSWLLIVLIIWFAARYVAFRMGHKEAFQS